MSTVTPYLSVLAICLAGTALFFTIKSYFLKRGTRLSGEFSFVSTVDCEDKYVSHILLENQKERSIAIFEILLQIGSNVYLEIESFEKTPLILRPYEVYRKDYDPIEFYSVNSKRVEINRLISDPTIKKRLVLSTTNGRYNVSNFLPRWNPVGDYFKNHMTAHVHPIRTYYKGKAYGSNVLFLAEFKTGNDEEVVPIRANDYEIQLFTNFQLTKESLQTKKSLSTFLQQQKQKKKLAVDKFIVIDLADFRTKNRPAGTERKTYSISRMGWFAYHVLGRFKTHVDDAKLRRINKKNLKKFKSGKVI